MKLSPQSNILVAINTCNRPQLLRENLKLLRQALNRLPGQGQDIDLVVSIDGMEMSSNQQAKQMALDMQVSCIVSDKPEGVGVSKNRVFKLLSDYDYYFFLEDDVKILDAQVFYQHIELFEQTGIHHFSLHEPERLIDLSEPTQIEQHKSIIHAQYGSAQFNFFTREALTTVGGFHRSFAKIRRGGHTEHSYRIYRAGLTPAPFNYAQHLASMCRWSNPPTVVIPHGHKVASNRLLEVENALIEQHLGQQPWFAQYQGHLCYPNTDSQVRYMGDYHRVIYSWRTGDNFLLQNHQKTVSGNLANAYLCDNYR